MTERFDGWDRWDGRDTLSLAMILAFFGAGCLFGWLAGRSSSDELMAEGERLLDRVHELEMEKIQATQGEPERDLTLLFPGDLDHRSKLILMEELIDLCLEDPMAEVLTLEEGATIDQE